ncbi:ABC transporter ATP-binding protein [Thalassotalea piscium]
MLKLTQINKTYADGTRALHDVTLTIPSGMVGLLGPNGAGKSSLMRTLACLQQPDTGSIVFDGLDVLAQPHALRLQLGYLPQSFGVYPNMSCRTLLQHIAVLKGVDKSASQTQIEHLLEVVNLSSVAHKRVVNFSGGMRQRFGIAQALLGDPKLIIMDEPTAGLDPMERESLNQLLVNISDQRLVLLSTHIVEDVENLCHHVAIINKGAVIESGNVEQLLASLENKIWQINALADSFPTKQILSKSYRYGKSSFRVYSEKKPSENATQVSTTLQDKYFYQLNQQGVA